MNSSSAPECAWKTDQIRWKRDATLFERSAATGISNVPEVDVFDADVASDDDGNNDDDDDDDDDDGNDDDGKPM